MRNLTRAVKLRAPRASILSVQTRHGEKLSKREHDTVYQLYCLLITPAIFSHSENALIQSDLQKAMSASIFILVPRWE